MKVLQMGKVRWAGRWQGLRHDAFAALCVFLLGLPLSLGSALASGAPAVAGLTAAAAAGILCGLVGGAPLMVTGPVVALATLCHKVTSTYDLGVLAAVTVAAGALQLSFSALRLGRLALAVAPSVLEGMLAGVGLTLLTTQAMAIVGAPTRGRVWLNLWALPEALWAANRHELVAAGMVVAVTYAWERTRLQRLMPGMLASLLAVSAWVQWAGWRDMRFIQVPDSGSGAWQLPWAQLAARSWPEVGQLWQLGGLAVELALVCTVYSLLSAASLDRTTRQPAANLNRELAGQGLANVVSGLLGGLPVSGAVLRSSANIRAGARSSRAVVLQGLCMVLALTQLHGLLGFIPISGLAANFLQLGARLVHPNRLRVHAKAKEALPFLVTAGGGIAINLFAGVVLGLAVSALQTLLRLARVRLRLVQRRSGHWQVQIRGICCFFQVPKLLADLAAIAPGDEATIFLDTIYCDAAVRHALEGWCQSHGRSGGRAQLVVGTGGLELDASEHQAA